MTTILIDRDIEGQTAMLWQAFASEGWLDLTPIDRVTFAMVGLPDNSPDRVVWRFAQERGMLLLTNNRNAKGRNSLGQTISEEATASTLPVLTIGNLDRLNDLAYRRRCVERIADIVLDLDKYMGVGRVFIS